MKEVHVFVRDTYENGPNRFKVAMVPIGVGDVLGGLSSDYARILAEAILDVAQTVDDLNGVEADGRGEAIVNLEEDDGTTEEE